MALPTLAVLEKYATKNISQLQKSYEDRIADIYKKALKEIQGEMKNLYDKYASVGKLSIADMARYNRYASMEKSMMELLDDAVRKSTLEIKHLLPDSYNQAFLNHAWAIDVSSGLRLNWGAIRPTTLAKMFNIDDLKNIYYSEALKNYRLDARKMMRKALMKDMAIGKSFDSMARDLKKAINTTFAQGLRIARTEGMTAINAGTDFAYDTAMEKGVEGKIYWDATLDGKTRPTHSEMDQAYKTENGWMRVDGIETPGPGGNPAPYPAFEGLPAEERINCRCTSRFEIDGYTPVLRRTRKNGVIPYQSFKQWNDGRVKVPEKIEITKKSMTPAEIQANFGDSLTRIKNLGGSTGAWLAEDDNNEKWVVKQYLNAQNPGDSVANEYIASQLYSKVGISVPEGRMAIIDGKFAFVTKMVEHGTTLGDYKYAISSSIIRQQVQNGFVADALFANWDSIGLDEDNILIRSGIAYRIDLGGSLLYRAQGTPKGANFTSNVINELKTLRDPKINTNAAKWFKKITDTEILNQIKNIQSTLTTSYIDEIIDASGLADDRKTLLKFKLQNRILALDQYAQDLSHKMTDKFAIQKVAEEIQEKGLTGFTPPSEDSFIYKIKDRYDKSDGEYYLNKAYQKMSFNEQAALKDFTSNGYYSYNAHAIAGNPDPNLKNAISKLPRVDKNLIRKIDPIGKNIKAMESNFNKWISGEWEDVEWKAFSSSSVSDKAWEGSYEFIIINDGTNLNAGYVGMLTSASANEREVLIDTNSKFKVIGYANDHNKKTLLLRPKAPWEPTGMSQPFVKEYKYSELMDIFMNDIKIYE